MVRSLGGDGTELLVPADRGALERIVAGAARQGRLLLPTGTDRHPDGLPRVGDCAGVDTGEGPGDDTGEGSGNVAPGVLSTARLAGIRELRAGDLTVRVGAGTRMDRLRTELLDRGLWLPDDPRGTSPSAGGRVAAGRAGPLDGSLGGVGRHLLACRMVDWRGETLRWGRAVMKNVAGYDLPRLLAGGHDRFGVLLSVTFRLWPAPEEDRLYRLRGEVSLAIAGELDARVRPDAVEWRRETGEEGGGEEGGEEDGKAGASAIVESGVRPGAEWLEVRLVGGGASVEARERRLLAWCAERGLEAGEPRSGPDHPASRANGSDGAAADEGGRRGEGEVRKDGTARHEGTGGPPRDPSVGCATLAPGRRGFTAAARAAAEALGPELVSLRGWPLEGRLRCAWRRGAESPLPRLLEALPETPVRLERGTARELEAVDRRRPAGLRALEERVVAALGGRARCWRSDHL